MESKHDKMIEIIAQRLRNEGKIVKTNPTGLNKYPIQPKNQINPIYPDVFVQEFSIIKEIYEVETDETVNEDEAKQWLLYSNTCQNFFLVVPKILEEKARGLIYRSGLRTASLRTY